MHHQPAAQNSQKKHQQFPSITFDGLIAGPGRAANLINWNQFKAQKKQQQIVAQLLPLNSSARFIRGISLRLSNGMRFVMEDDNNIDEFLGLPNAIDPINWNASKDSTKRQVVCVGPKNSPPPPWTFGTKDHRHHMKRRRQKWTYCRHLQDMRMITYRRRL